MEASSSNRQELIRNAVLFLNDPKVASSSLTSRIQFLESKGLNEGEIQRALSQAQSQTLNTSTTYDHAPPERPSGPAPRYAYGYDTGVVRAPEPPKRDWRDLFIMAVISGGVVYGLTALAKKYLLPHLQPPSTTSFQETSSSLAEGYDEASRLLRELNEQTAQLQSSVEADRERVNAVVGEVEEALRSVRGGEERWREEMRDIRGEVESVRELVPKMIEKHAQSQTAALTDLQAELTSLKTLLLSRHNANPAPNGSPASSGASGARVSNATAAANALLTPRGQGIPAWQLPSASASAKDGTTSRSESEGASGTEGDGGKGKGKEKETSEQVKEDGV